MLRSLLVTRKAPEARVAGEGVAKTGEKRFCAAESQYIVVQAP